MLFFQAWLGLFAYDIVCKRYSFHQQHVMVKQWKVAHRSSDDGTIERVSAAVNYACIWYPKQAQCLQRSFVVTSLLRKHGVPAQMVIGAQKLPFKAHAWVEVEGRPINERSNVQAIYSVWDRC